LAQELVQRGHQISYLVVAQLPDEPGYGLQAKRKTEEGGTHPDRNVQFA
jgi:hypothetical protein